MSSFSKLGALSWWKYQCQLVGLALMFFTQVPVPKNIPYSEERMNKANRYFSLIGLFIGSAVVAVYFLIQPFWSTEIVVILVMIFSAILTGAFHEDGLADMADGMGGGYTTEKRLTIMKDSRLGTYGALTLVLAILLKYQLLVALANNGLFPFAVLVSYGLSRAVAASLIVNTPYVTDLDASKSKPLASKQSIFDIALLFCIACIPVIFTDHYVNESLFLLASLAITLLIFRTAFRRWLLTRLNGFTGDCLGGAQQISELIIYLVLLNHITQFGAL